jgi:hypothetical protein
MTYGLIGVVAAAASIICLYLSWQKRFPLQRWLMPAGWLVAIVSGLFFIISSGAEFGVAYVFMIVPLMAWFAVLYNLEIKRKHIRSNETVNFVVPATRTILRHIALFFIVVPLAGTASAYVSVVLALLLPWSTVNAVVLIVLIAPLIWGLASWWACADPNRYRPALWISAAGLISAAVVYSQ